MNHRLILLIAVILNICLPSGAQMLRDSVLINFRQSKVNLDTTYMGNPEALEHARKAIEFYHRPDSNFVLKNVAVVGGASPEGSVKINERLSRQRAAKIFNYIGASFDLPDSLTTFTYLGRDWAGLYTLVLADDKVPYRDEVIDLLGDILSSYRSGELESHGNLARIKRLRGGVPYSYMYSKLFPKLRASKLILTFDKPYPWKADIFTLPVAPIDTRFSYPEPRLADVVMPQSLSPFYMALKSNMLYDALAVPNIGIEFYLGKNISLGANWMYGWWKNDTRHRYWRVYGGDLALRWWFGKKAHQKPLTGHHLGIYGGLLTYDLEWGGRGYMGGIPGGTLWDRCNHHFGVEYGYSLPVARRLNIDFTLGLGYLGGEYREYIPIDNHYVWQATKYRRWLGPTKAEISLVWLIGRGNFNKGKGGGL